MRKQINVILLASVYTLLFSSPINGQEFDNNYLIIAIDSESSTNCGYAIMDISNDSILNGSLRFNYILNESDDLPIRLLNNVLGEFGNDCALTQVQEIVPFPDITFYLYFADSSGKKHIIFGARGCRSVVYFNNKWWSVNKKFWRIIDKMTDGNCKKLLLPIELSTKLPLPGRKNYQ